MREIRFRAWDPLNKRIVHKGFALFDGYVDELKHQCDVVFPIGDTTYAYLNGLENIPNPKDLNLMQYTGLKDKNSVEIYEGDILEWDLHYSGDYKHNPGTGYVVFEEGSFDLHPIIEKHWSSELSNLAINSEVKVLGNIYENQELLGKK